MAEAWQNPYTPGAATIPPSLTGRDEMLSLFHDSLLAREAGGPAQYLVLSGHRGMGKTVLLYAFRDMARERDWLAVRVEATDRGVFLASLAQSIIDTLEQLEARAGLLKRARTALDELTVALGVGPAKVEVKAKRAAPAAGLGLDTPVERLIDALGTAAKERKSGAAFLIDELQAVPAPALRALARALQSAEGERLPVVLSAGGLPHAPDRLRSAVSYAERYRYLTLGPLTAPSVRIALEEPAARLGVRYDPAALDQLVSASEGYPYLVQLLGSRAWEAARGATPITEAHAGTAITAARNDLVENVLRSRWARASAKDRAYLTAMASLGRGPVTSGDVARAFGERAQQLSVVRQRVIDKGLVVTTPDGGLDFAIPGFGPFVLAETGASSPPELAAQDQPAPAKALPPARGGGPGRSPGTTPDRERAPRQR